MGFLAAPRPPSLAPPAGGSLSSSSMRMPTLEFTVNAAQRVVQGIAADPSPDVVQGIVLQQEEWERQ